MLESLFETTTLSKEEFLSLHDPKTSILPVFANIHSESDNEQEASTSEQEASTSEQDASTSEEELSMIER